MGFSLREVFTPLFSYLLLFGRTPSYQQRTFADIRAEIESLLEQQKERVKQHDIAVSDYENARFAVVAWVDELILRYTYGSNRDLYEQWKRAPLQVTLYNTAKAGEEFFERFERLNPAQKEIYEIYHLCLCLGFRGRYYDEAQDHKLRELRRESAQHLPIPVLDVYDIEKTRERVTPQPYTVPPPQPQPRPRSPSLLWAGLALPVLAILLLYLLWPWPPEPKVRTLQEIIADIEEQIRYFECSHLTVVDFQNGVVRLEGRVQSEAQREDVWQAVKHVPEVSEVRDTFSILPWPFCEVIDLLAPFQRRGQELGVNLQVQPHKGCDEVYYRNENLVTNITVNSPLQYVYVDYYVADKEHVAHLFPNRQQQDNSLKGATALVVGEPGSQAQWRIEPPFGMELVTVVISPQPLFAQHRLDPESAASYLEKLRSSLPRETSDSAFVASYCFITTEDR